MTLPRRVHNAWVNLCLDAQAIWTWHRYQMDSNPRYARAFVQGVVSALWQDSIEKFVVVLLNVATELFKILRQDGVNLGSI
jgi:hypothetical protein